MTIFDGDRDKLGEYVRELADLMGLRDWTVNLALMDADDDGACARQFVPYGTQRVDLKIAREWHEWEPADLRVTLVHELAHCHTVRMMWTFNAALGEVMGASLVFNLAARAFTTDHEVAVESIATAWARTLPLPVMDADEEREEAA